MEKHVLGISTEVIAMAIMISIILLFLGVGVLVLIHVCIVGRTIIGREINDTNTTNMERGSFGSTSMSQDDIEKLPCFDFKAKETGSSPLPDCAVCLESFRVGEKCRLLPSCKHSFHAECVDLWLVRAPICPICRGGADSVIKDGELGLNLTEVVDSSERVIEDEMGLNSREEVVDSSESVIEVREMHDN